MTPDLLMTGLTLWDTPLQVLHRGVPRAASDWHWEANAQLVIVAQQGQVGTPSWRQAAQRYIPPHVLWQWVPYWPTATTGSARDSPTSPA